jgi:DNA-binding transcriptional ArsR family regulator
MFEPKVTLDQASFRALASETRIAILRGLSQKPMTLTDLANHLQISKPGVMKHLDLLQEAGLVLRDPPERKWILYRLTTKGERILDPNRTRIALALGFSALAALLGVASAALVGAPPTSQTGSPGLSVGQMALALVPYAVLFLGLVATLASLVSWRRRPRASDDEILKRLGDVPEESLSAGSRPLGPSS